MILKVECRDSKNILVNCGYGHQSFKWLGNIVKLRYAEQHPQFAPEQFLPIHIMNKNSIPLYPHEIIKDKCQNGDAIKVELLGPRIGPHDPNYTREQTLWELYAFTPLTNYVTVCFRFDTTEYEPLEETPGIFGNFNGWGVPVPMNRTDDNGWEFVTEFPASAEVVFMFHIGANLLLSADYESVADQQGQKMNYLKVTEPNTDYAELKVDYPDYNQYFIKKNAGEEGVPRVLTSRVVAMNKFEGIKQLTEDMRMNIFNADWQRFGMEESLTEPVVREKLKATLYRYFDDIQNVFRIYSTQGAKDIGHMSALQFYNFLYTCKFPGPQKIPISKLDELFHMVNAKKEWSEEESSSKQSVTDDPLAVENQFIRPEFMQALVRIAQLKYRALGPDTSIDRLFKEHILPVALHPDMKDLRSKIMDSHVYKVLQLYRNRLYKLYLLYSSKNKSADQIVPSITVANFQKMCTEMHLLEHGQTVKKCCFSLSEIEGKETVAIPPPDDDYEMSYTEFVEGLIRLSNYEEPKDPKKADKKEEAAEAEVVAPPIKLCYKIEALCVKMFPTPTNKRTRKVRTAFIGFRPEL